MDEQVVIYVIPYVIAFLFSAGVGFYAWHRRQVVGALPFAVLVWSEAFWTLGYCFELLASGLETKIFWDNVQFISTFVGPMTLLGFALDYTNQRLLYRRLFWNGLIGLTGLWLFILFAFPQHDLVRPDAWLVTEKPFSALYYDFGSLVWLMAFYGYSIFFIAVILLGISFVQARSVYRVQIAIILIGVSIPLVGTVLTVIGISFTVQRDNAPFMFVLGNVIVAWGLFRYQLFDLVPIARNLVVDSITDTVVVLDSQLRVVDLNAAGQRTLQLESSSAIGLSAHEVFGNWPDLVTRFQGVDDVHVEIEVSVDGINQHFDLRISAVHDRLGNRSGTVIVVRNISERKQVEQELEHYREHLEVLVEQRTAELFAAQTALSQERQRLARELHDSVTQTVFAANTVVEILPRMLEKDPAKASDYFVELRQLTRGAMAELRALMIELRPSALRQTELGVLIKQLCDVFTGNTRVDIAFHAPQKLFLPEKMQIAFYRVAQEALNIIAKHAQATAVSVYLTQHEHEIELRIEAISPSFDPLTITPDQTGIQSMHGHVQECGAELSIINQEEKGAIIKVVGVIVDD